MRQTLIEATDEKYNDLLKNVNIKKTVLKDQINTINSVLRTRLENLANTVEDILDSLGWHDTVPDLECEEYAAQRRNQTGQD